MIPMACPNCGRRGTVPPDKLNSRLHCKKCDTVFHLDMSGAVVLGEPGATRTKTEKPKVRKAESYDTSLGSIWQELPKSVKIGGAVILGVVAIYFSGLRLPKVKGIPQDLMGRAAMIAEAFADDDIQRARKVIDPATMADAEAWHKMLRPSFIFTPPQEPGNMVVFSGSVRSEDKSSGAEVLVNMMPPFPNFDEKNRYRAVKASGYRPDGSFDLWLYFKTDSGDRWVLDGSKTLKVATEEAAKTEAMVKGKTKAKGS